MEFTSGRRVAREDGQVVLLLLQQFGPFRPVGHPCNGVERFGIQLDPDFGVGDHVVKPCRTFRRAGGRRVLDDGA